VARLGKSFFLSGAIHVFFEKGHDSEFGGWNSCPFYRPISVNLRADIHGARRGRTLRQLGCVAETPFGKKRSLVTTYCITGYQEKVPALALNFKTFSKVSFCSKK
jgi:hypothetical protein